MRRKVRSWRLRAARTLMASVAGAGLSVAGVVFQSLLRNPLAEPYVLGVTAGAGVGAALAIVTGITVLRTLDRARHGLRRAPWARFFWCRPWPARRRARCPWKRCCWPASPSARCSTACLMFVVSVAPSEKLHGVVWWLLGNLQVVDWRLLEIVAVVVAAGLAVAVLWARDLNLMALGDEPAAHLGLNVTRSRHLFFVVASLVTGATVAVLRDHRLRGADRAACRAADRRAGPSPPGAGGRAGRRRVSGAGRLPRPTRCSRKAKFPSAWSRPCRGGPLFLMLLRKHKAATGIDSRFRLTQERGWR